MSENHRLTPSAPLGSKEPNNSLKNNIRWFKQKLKEGRTIIDIGPDPNREERSPYYGAEEKLNEEQKRRYEH